MKKLSLLIITIVVSFSNPYISVCFGNTITSGTIITPENELNNVRPVDSTQNVSLNKLVINGAEVAINSVQLLDVEINSDGTGELTVGIPGFNLGIGSESDGSDVSVEIFWLKLKLGQPSGSHALLGSTIYVDNLDAIPPTEISLTIGNDLLGQKTYSGVVGDNTATNDLKLDSVNNQLEIQQPIFPDDYSTAVDIADAYGKAEDIAGTSSSVFETIIKLLENSKDMTHGMAGQAGKALGVVGWAIKGIGAVIDFNSQYDEGGFPLAFEGLMKNAFVGLAGVAGGIGGAALMGLLGLPAGPVAIITGAAGGVAGSMAASYAAEWFYDEFLAGGYYQLGEWLETAGKATAKTFADGIGMAVDWAQNAGNTIKDKWEQWRYGDPPDSVEIVQEKISNLEWQIDEYYAEWERKNAELEQLRSECPERIWSRLEGLLTGKLKDYLGMQDPPLDKIIAMAKEALSLGDNTGYAIDLLLKYSAVQSIYWKIKHLSDDLDWAKTRLAELQQETNTGPDSGLPPTSSKYPKRKMPAVVAPVQSSPKFEKDDLKKVEIGSGEKWRLKPENFPPDEK